MNEVTVYSLMDKLDRMSDINQYVDGRMEWKLGYLKGKQGERERIKQEAIKLVKKKSFMTEEGINVIDINWIKEFFNITEEDSGEKGK
ncbi:MAG: hypothetical protein ACOCUD_01625 [Bacillota bacterium]